MSKVRNLPATEDGRGVLCKTKSGKEYCVSQNTAKMRFTLWQVLTDEYKKILSTASPTELYDLIPWKA